MIKVVHCKLEKFDVYVGRPTKFGNPFSHKENTTAKYKTTTAQEAVEKYEEWLMTQPELIAAAKAELKGKTLSCWCKFKGDEWCHGDVLMRIANG